MFIFYKMEYVIAYKMLLKESIDEKKTFFGNVTCLKLEHAVLLIFMSLCLESMTQHHFVWNVFCNANVKYTSTFQCCYDQCLLFLSLLHMHRHEHTGDTVRVSAFPLILCSLMVLLCKCSPSQSTIFHYHSYINKISSVRFQSFQSDINKIVHHSNEKTMLEKNAWLLEEMNKI